MSSDENKKDIPTRGDVSYKPGTFRYHEVPTSKRRVFFDERQLELNPCLKVRGVEKKKTQANRIKLLCSIFQFRNRNFRLHVFSLGQNIMKNVQPKSKTTKRVKSSG